MKILLSGGGTGGHITPILAVAHELKRTNPDCHIVYVGEKGGKFAALTKDNPDIDETHSVYAGKFRRYHGESWFRRIVDIQTILLNIRDFFLFIIGTLQSLVLIKRLKPDVILLKGGFVGVPVGLSAAFWRIPFVTHDSDAIPGLANRMVARWAAYHATGLPPEFYGYPKESIRYVGVLVESNYKMVTPELQRTYKQQLSVADKSRLLLIIGGSGGAAAVNAAVRQLAPVLLDAYPDLRIIHQVGHGKAGIYHDFSHDRLQVIEFLQPMHVYTGASDVVVTRAGANTLAELGTQAKACVVIPNPLLTGGHQIKNVEHIAKAGAVIVVDEQPLKSDVSSLQTAIVQLLESGRDREHMAKKLHDMTVTDAAAKLAMLLLDVAAHT